MPAHHCPFCNAQNTAAIGVVAFGGQPLVEHRCGYCGRLFCIGDRRFTTKRSEKSFHIAQSYQLAARTRKLQ